MNPTLQHEKELIKNGYKFIAGLDEVGRGALAGPVVAGCVLVSDTSLKSFPKKLRLLIKDSKRLSAKKREQAYDILVQYFPFTYGSISCRRIDNIGIGNAIQEAMQQALDKLSHKPDFVLTDGGRFSFKLPYRIIIGGDNLVFCVAASSIIAKVIRDRMLIKEDKRFSKYGFGQHKGYGTKRHLQALETFGSTTFHRKSFSPVKNMV